jgi:hypothetical protein
MSTIIPPAHPDPRAPEQHALARSAQDCAAQLRDTFAWKPGERREVRCFARNGVHHAIVSSAEEAAAAIGRVEYGTDVFITLNPVAPSAAVVESTGNSLVRAGRGDGVADSAIDRRTRFVIDIDPVRPAKTSATVEQLAEARALAKSMTEALSAEGWPSPTEVCSGNGMHLYYAVDLPTASDLPRRALRGLDERFSTDTVKVDTTVSNAARLMRVPGTWNAKGSDRCLHRVAELERAGEDRLLTADQLESVAAGTASSAAAVSPSASATGVSFDLERWLTRHGVKHRGKEAWPGAGEGASRWVLDCCPFDPAHDRGEAVITQQPSGAVGFTCHHNSCGEYKWQDFRTAVESAAQGKNAAAASIARAPYPLDALPGLLQAAVSSQVKATGVDEAAVAVPLLTAMLGVVGNSVVVEVWPQWRESLVGWTALVAPSGQMKSATLGFAEHVLRAVEDGFPPPAAGEKRQRLVVNDSTCEALCEVASRNLRGLILFRDELAGFLDGIGQYKPRNSADEAFWLSAYEGKRHAVDRRSTGSTVVRRLLVSVLGGIQPPVLKEALRARRREQSGFAARFWLIQPPPRLITIDRPSEQLLRSMEIVHASVRLCMESLHSIPMPNGDPMALPMETTAADRLASFGTEQEAIAFGLDDSSVERACRHKSRGWVAKLAGLIALVRGYEAVGPRPDGDPRTPDWTRLTIKHADVEDAIRLVEWQVGENRRVLQNLELDDLDRHLERQDQLARAALDPATGSTTVRAYSRKHGVEAAEAERILKGLEKAKRWGVRHPKPSPSGGRPVAIYFPLADACLH